MQMIAGGFLSSGLTCDRARAISELLAQLRQAGCGLGGLGSCFPKSNSLQQFSFARSGISHLIIGLIPYFLNLCLLVPGFR